MVIHKTTTRLQNAPMGLKLHSPRSHPLNWNDCAGNTSMTSLSHSNMHSALKKKQNNRVRILQVCGQAFAGAA